MLQPEVHMQVIISSRLIFWYGVFHLCHSIFVSFQIELCHKRNEKKTKKMLTIFHFKNWNFSIKNVQWSVANKRLWCSDSFSTKNWLFYSKIKKIKCCKFNDVAFFMFHRNREEYVWMSFRCIRFGRETEKMSIFVRMSIAKCKNLMIASVLYYHFI